jgi:hypothetical protein
MSPVACIGEAAGTAMALAIKNKSTTRAVDVQRLQKALKNNGAYLGI